MICRTVLQQLPTYVEGDLPEAETRQTVLHLSQCAACDQRCEEIRQSRSRMVGALRSLAIKPVPAALEMRVRVAASHQREANRGRAEFSTAGGRWWLRMRLAMRDLMRPLAVPAAGGLLSSVVCFAMLAGTFSFPQQSGVNDVPIGFTTQVEVDQLSPFGYTGHDVVIELTIDKEGKVANYSAHGSVTRDDMKQLGNLILFTSFAPATAFGQPTSGKILLSCTESTSEGNGPAEARAALPSGSECFAAHSGSGLPGGEPLILEIGPGKGALTEHLLTRARHVVAIELDRELAASLPSRFPSLKTGHLEVVQGDALQVDLNLWPGVPVVGNLPYYVATPIISRVVRLRRPAVFLIQKEVAERIVANAGSRDYGYFSVDTQFFAHAELLFTVKPGSFRPPPQVESAVIRLRPREAFADASPEAFLEFVSRAFRQRRKTLRNNLAPFYGKEAVERQPEAGARAEVLTVAEFAMLFRRLVP